ncbi:hypothetical protein [Xylophilus sp. Leaf220]|uniref:hypothetical protein n=1 Tax=Xylophilus sp. Leaf220 TaxID=1735686 RepID=UPI0006FCE929|nr:hypothetical protein [Xylophilus sp. Leaf220]KQM78922.1 hypothetical protein ASE76_16155 [Xylophilus sp. Leaf220]
MGDMVGLIAELKGPFGAYGAITIALLVYLWRERSQRAVGAANNEANISAIEHWKEAAAEAKAALLDMTQRADRFAEGRNEAVQALGELRGQLGEMTRQLTAQSQQLDQQAREMQGLREQVASLKEQLNGHA